MIFIRPLSTTSKLEVELLAKSNDLPAAVLSFNSTSFSAHKKLAIIIPKRGDETEDSRTACQIRHVKYLDVRCEIGFDVDWG